MANYQKTRKELIDMYVKSLEEGEIPWEKMWKTSLPENAVTGKKYKGINNLLLSYIASKRCYQDNRWCTYLQMKKNNWKFIKEAKGHGVSVEYWVMKNKQDNKIYTFEQYQTIIDNNPELTKNFYMKALTYTVFNGDLIDGLVKDKKEPVREIISNDYVKNIIANLGVGYIEKGYEAYYLPINDQVVLPPANCFQTTNSYYATQLHELAHATGHESRLNRNIQNSFGTEEYAKEELRAEISSSFLMQKFNLEEDERHLNNHKSYVKNWLEILKNNPKELFEAINDANKITDYLEENSISKDKKIEADLEMEMEYE